MSVFGQPNNNWTISIANSATSSHLVTQQPSISNIRPKTSREASDLFVNTTQAEFAETCSNLSTAMSDTDSSADGSGEMMLSYCSDGESSKPYAPLDLSGVHPERQYAIALENLRQSVESSYEARSLREAMPQLQVLESDDEVVVLSPESLFCPEAEPILIDNNHNNKRRTSSGLIQPRRPSQVDTSQQTWNNVGRNVQTPIESMESTVELLDKRSARRRKRPVTHPDPAPAHKTPEKANTASQASPVKVRSVTSPSSHPVRRSRTDEQSPKRPRLSLDTPALQPSFSPPAAPRAMLRPSSSSGHKRTLPPMTGGTRDSQDSPRLLTPDSLSTGPPTPTRKDEWKKSSAPGYITIERQNTKSVSIKAPIPLLASAEITPSARTVAAKPISASATMSLLSTANNASGSVRRADITAVQQAGTSGGSAVQAKNSRWDLKSSEPLAETTVSPKVEERDATPDMCMTAVDHEAPLPTSDKSANVQQQTTPRKPPGTPFHPTTAWSPDKQRVATGPASPDTTESDTRTRQHVVSRIAEQIVKEVQPKLDPEYFKLGLQKIAQLTDQAMQVTVLSHWANIQRPEGQASLFAVRADKTDQEIEQNLMGLIVFCKFVRDLHRELDKKKLARDKEGSNAAAITKLAVRDKDPKSDGGTAEDKEGDDFGGKARSSTGSCDSNRTIVPAKNKALVQDEHADPRLRHKKIGPR